MAENISATEFSALMNRFYGAATDVLIKTDAFIDKLIGDEVMAVYLPMFAGKEPARLAVQAAQELLEVTGHGDPEGAWIPIGVGVHTGIAFFGTVAGAEGTVSDFTALGDAVNIGARLASRAGAGEALISDAACAASGVDLGHCEQRQLELKGKSEPVAVRVVTQGGRLQAS